MRWLFASAELRSRGVLGLNRRNLEYLDQINDAPLLEAVDDKRVLATLAQRIGVPTPCNLLVIDHPAKVVEMAEIIAESGEVVVKPARGLSGQGIIIVHQGFNQRDLEAHIHEILSGRHSLGNQPDVAIIQERIITHPMFEKIAYQGLPDIRLILREGEPTLAMLRLPTTRSSGKANLAQGGIGVAIELQHGITYRALDGDQQIERHPDTGHLLLGVQIPDWKIMVEMATRVARAVPLRLLGVDMVADPQRGPMLLEANARPGLTIQRVTGMGLLA